MKVFPTDCLITRMHSSRMRTVCCSGCLSCHACPPPPTMHTPHHTHTPAMHVPCHAHPPCHACPPATHTPLPRMMPPAMHAPPPREQNHRCLWKHNLAATTLRTVIMSMEKISTILLSVILRYNSGFLEKDRRYHVTKFEPVSLLLYICSSVHKAPFHYETLTNERPFGMGLKVRETLEFNP